MDIKVIKEVLTEFTSHKLTKLKVKWNDIEIEVEKDNQQANEKDNKINNYAKPIKEEIKEETKEETIEKENIDEIVSPMVGTVYLASSPDSEPFVKVGQKIKKGDVVCIIEAMKLMNEVEAETDGVIKEVLVENEQMIEYNEGLFIISP